MSCGFPAHSVTCEYLLSFSAHSVRCEQVLIFPAYSGSSAISCPTHLVTCLHRVFVVCENPFFPLRDALVNLERRTLVHVRHSWRLGSDRSSIPIWPRLSITIISRKLKYFWSSIALIVPRTMEKYEIARNGWYVKETALVLLACKGHVRH